MIRVLLVDDHAVLRSGLRLLITDDPAVEVVGEAADGEEAVRLAQELEPDVVVMDLSMPRMDGVEAIRRMRAAGVRARVLVLTVHEESQSLIPALAAGADGYVGKFRADLDLIDGIHAVAAGRSFLYPSAVAHLLHCCMGDAPAQATGAASALSAREREVLALTAAGFSASQIAGQLSISPKTVDTYRQRVMEKLDAHHRSDLVRVALREGLLTGAA